MPGEPSSCCIHRLSSWLSQLKKRISSSFAPASPAPHLYSRLPDDSIDAPVHCPNTDVCPAPVAPCASVSSASVHSTTTSIPACSSPCLSPSPPASLLRLHPQLSATGAEELETPDHHADPELSPASVLHHTPVPSLSSHSVAKLVLARPSRNSSSCSPDFASCQHLPLPEDNTGRLDVLAHHLNIPDLPLGSASQRPSPSSVAPPCIAISNASLYLPASHVLLDHNTARLDAPHTADTEEPPTFSRPPSVSRSPTPSAAIVACAGPTLSPQHTTRRPEDRTGQNYWSTYLPPPLPQGQALTYQGPSHMFSEAHDFTVKDSTFIQGNTTTDNFMKELLQETIIGAEFDSSARDPPPRCHPGTRLAIIQRCLDFIKECIDEGKLRWVVGPAGVGKSAVMQMVTETVPDDIVFASVFLSVNGRRDGNKIVLTIAYQLAVKSGSYRQFIHDQITFDPSLLTKSLSVQFKKFIVEPFMFRNLFEPSRRFLVVIDGLDECDDSVTQQKLLELITDFCITHPTSPIAWIIASRPEPHITSFFDKDEVRRAYSKEEIQIDSDEACEEVQRYLRDELKKIKDEHPTLRYKREWPLEHEFTKIASAAGGLFAYAATVTRFIGDRTHGGPAAQLRRVLELIDASPKDHVAGRYHPMDGLDALYRRILSNIPNDVMTNTRKLLILHSHNRFKYLGFRTQCNALGLTEDDAYDAVDYLHAVMKIPEPDKADDQLSYYHKSFNDFLHDFERSGFSRDFSSEGYQLDDSTSFKIIEDLHDDGIANGGDICVDSDGLMKGCCDNIPLSWPGDGRLQKTDRQIRIALYRKAIEHARIGFSTYDDLRKSVSHFHVSTTRYTKLPPNFPLYELQTAAFERFRDEVAKLGKLEQAPLRTFDYAAVCGDVEVRFTSPTGSNFKVSDPRDPSCKHYKRSVGGIEHRRGWSTSFRRYHQVNSGIEDDGDTDIPRFYVSAHQQSHEEWIKFDTRVASSTTCFPCTRRFAHHFMNNQDVLATVFVDGTQMSYVEVTVMDPDDGVSEWRYRFLHSGRPSSHNA